MTGPAKSVANGAGYCTNKKSDTQSLQVQKRQSLKKDYLIPKLKVNDKNNTVDPDGYTSQFPSESVNNSYNSGSSSDVDESNNTETHMLLQQKQLCSTSTNSQTVDTLDGNLQHLTDELSVNVIKKLDSVNVVIDAKVNGNIINTDSLKPEKIDCNGCCDVDTWSEADSKSEPGKASKCSTSKNQLKPKSNMLLNINR